MARIDWKECLPPEEKKILAEILEKTKAYQCAFTRASDVKVAQLWCALVEMMKELREVRDTLEKVKAPFVKIIEIGDIEKRRAIERIISDIVKPTDRETEEATKKLVDSLMKF